MSVGLDTSVVLRLLVGEPVDQASAAWAFVTDDAVTQSGPVHVSDLVIGEAYFGLRHHYRVPHAEALEALAGLAGDARFEVTEAARRSIHASRTSRSTIGFMDRLIHADYQDMASHVVTFDREAARLPGAYLLG